MSGQVSEFPATVYTPSSALADPCRLIGEMFRDVWAGRELAWRLFIRDTAALYRQSVLGYVWAILPPVATTGTFAFLNSQNILQVGPTPIPYIAYVLTGTLLWQGFVDALNSPLKAVTANRSLLLKISFPREALIMSGLFDVLFNAIIRLLLLVPVFIVFKLPLTATILLFPFGFATLILLGLSLGLFLTPLGMLYTDIGRGLAIVSTFWLFLTPVVYPPPKSPLALLLSTINPVSPVIVTTRNWLISQPATHLTGLFVVAGLALLLLFASAIVYRVALPHLIERMGG